MSLARRFRLLLVALCLLLLATEYSSAQVPTTYGDLSQSTVLAESGSLAGSSPLGQAISGPPQPQPVFATEIPALNRVTWPKLFRHGDPEHPGRNVGIGQPLETTSWRNRPFHIGWLVGGVLGDGLMPNSLRQEGALIGGYRIGWDFDHYWGTEFRFGFSHMDLHTAQGAGLGRSSHNQFYDWSLSYYPWGDAAWRPFASIGIGARKFRFGDINDVLVDDYAFEMPIGFGVKYYYEPWMALRFSVVDNFSPAAHALDTMHNISITAGVEIHYGGRRRSYFPYHPGGVLW